MKLLLSICMALLLNTAAIAQDQTQPKVLIRIDDVGMNYDSIVAAERVLKTGMPVSISVMVASPWYPQAFAMLKQYPNAAIGVHLTLNAEWANMKFQPVLGASAVPSLVDSEGQFHATVADFLASNYQVAEIERELRAQIERALASGLKIDYLDAHMGMIYHAHAPTLIQLADEYQLGIASHFNENYHSLWAVPISDKQTQLLSFLQQPSDNPILIETHLSIGSDEMNVLFDSNSRLMQDQAGKSIVGQHRKAELDALLSPEAQQAFSRVRLMNYRELIQEHGLATMRRKVLSGKPAGL